jgi:hypothetical protein
MENWGGGILGMQRRRRRRQRRRTVHVQYDLKVGAAENCFGDRKGQVGFSITTGQCARDKAPNFHSPAERLPLPELFRLPLPELFWLPSPKRPATRLNHPHKTELPPNRVDREGCIQPFLTVDTGSPLPFMA